MFLKKKYLIIRTLFTKKMNINILVSLEAYNFF